jgi:hypothetical protein
MLARETELRARKTDLFLLGDQTGPVAQIERSFPKAGVEGCLG